MFFIAHRQLFTLQSAFYNLQCLPLTLFMLGILGADDPYDATSSDHFAPLA
jgi:hypothetical protein